MRPTTLVVQVVNANDNPIQNVTVSLTGHAEDSTYVKDLSQYNLMGSTDENGYFKLDLSEFYADEANNGFATLNIRAVNATDTAYSYITLEEESADTTVIRFN